jgi:steroid delta-isomerase-like uncharacterized protein
MTRDDIAALFTRRQDALDRLDAPALARDYAEDCVLESPLAGGTAVGREAIEKVYAAFFQAFSDLKFRQEDLVIDGDHVALFVHASASGTTAGSFLGMPSRGRPVNIPMAIIYELRNGLILRERRVYDFTGLLVQVGALKAKPS